MFIQMIHSFASDLKKKLYDGVSHLLLKRDNSC